jgi:hypothetical protein
MVARRHLNVSLYVHRPSFCIDYVVIVDILCCRIRRDKYGNLGIQIMAGSDGGLYVQSVVPGGPAAAVGNVHRGTVLLYELCYV